MAHLSMEGTSAMAVDNLALLRMSQAVQGLDNILQEFREVEKMTGPQTAASAEGSAPENAQMSKLCVEATPTSLIHLVAGTLKGKVEKLLAGIKDDAELQKLNLPTLQKSTKAPNDAANEVMMISEQPTGSVDTIPALSGGSKACIPGREPKLARISGQNTGCRHFCKHHPEVIDPWLWSTLPLELMEIVFAKLSMPKIIDLTRGYEAWAELSEASNFRQFCSERHPKLFSIVRWDAGSIQCDTVRASVFDIRSNEWVSFDLVGFPDSRRCSRAAVDYGYEDSLVAHDGGLICFVPPSDLAVAPVLICNPLTGEWRRLPLIPHEHRRSHLVQLVVDEDTKGYKVIIVCGRMRMEHEIHVCVTPAPDDSTHCYDSSTRLWSNMETGYVYGGGRSLKQHRREAPAVFDCRTKVLYQLKYRIPESRLSQTRSILSWSSVKDRLVVLHDSTTISEFAWLGSKYSTHRTVEVGPYRHFVRPPHEVFIFASENFYLVIGDNSKQTLGKHEQLIQVYDRSAKTWHRASPMAADEVLNSGCLRKAFMCELRWDAIP